MTNQNPLINILIRTTGTREASFNKCLMSILSQTYKYIRIIVSYDCEETPDYIPKVFNMPVVVVYQPTHNSPMQYAVNDVPQIITIIKVNKSTEYSYNLYCNDLKDQVTDGYLLYLDDDDIFENNKSLERIAPFLSDKHITICQMIRGRLVKPLRGEIESGKIGMPCFVLHHSHKDLAQFDDSSNADYKFISEVCSKIPHRFVPIAVVRSDRRSFGA